MATHSSVLTWRIRGMGEPGGLPSMGSHRVWYDWSDLTAAAHIYPNLVVQMVEKLPEMQETWVRYLGWEDTLEKGMATHSTDVSWKMSWTEKPGGLQSMGSQRVNTTEKLTVSFSFLNKWTDKYDVRASQMEPPELPLNYKKNIKTKYIPHYWRDCRDFCHHWKPERFSDYDCLPHTHTIYRWILDSNGRLLET